MLRSVPKCVWIIALGHGVTDLSPGALYVALPFLKAKLVLTYVQVSGIVLVQNIAASISQPFFGYLCDKKSRAWMMPVGCVVSGLGLLGALLAPNYWLVLLCTGLSGLGNAAFHPEAAKLVNYLSGKSLGKGASLFSVWGSVGIAAGSMFLAFLLADGAGGKLFFYMIPFLVCGAALTYAAAVVPVFSPKGAGGLRHLKASFNWSVAAMLGMVAARSTVSSGISAFVPLYYVSYLHGSQIYASSLLTVYMAAGAVGTMLGGTASDKFGSKTVMLYSIMPLSFLLYLFRFAEGAWPFIILAIVSMLLSATFTSSLVLMQKMMPGNIGMASGLNLGFSVGLGTMGVLALGKIADMWSMLLIFDILAFLPIIGLILTLFIQEPEEPEGFGVQV